jgi:hypothetical protein
MVKGRMATFLGLSAMGEETGKRAKIMTRKIIDKILR